MRIVLLGAPGSGKGTQGQLMAQRYKIPLISTGEVLRQAVADRTALGRQARIIMDEGKLVPDEIVLGIIRDRLDAGDTRNGFILDGFPRNLTQAEALDELLGSIDQPLQLALLFDVGVDVLMQRLSGRRTCGHCGQVYNIFTSPPKMDGRCDECGHVLRHRADDNEETIGNRLRIYETQTMPVIDFYRNQTRLRRVQGVGEPGQVFAAVRTILDALKKASAAEARKRSAEASSGSTWPATKEVTAKEPDAKSGGKTSSKKSAKKKTETRKKVAQKAKKKAATRSAGKKKAAAKKTAAKKKPAVKKKTTVKSKKKSVAGKKAAGKAAARKSSSKKTAQKKKSTASKSSSKKKSAARKAVSKKTPMKKKVAVSKKKAVSKKTTVKKKTTKKKTVKKKTTAAKRRKRGRG